LEARDFWSVDTLRDGRKVEIRSRTSLIAAVRREASLAVSRQFVDSQRFRTKPEYYGLRQPIRRLPRPFVGAIIHGG
jgi:hypothetical protein